MKLRLRFLAIGVVLLALFSGCATPESRIRRNPELFARLTPEQQEMIRRGEVAVGFTPEMVRLALGDPDRVAVRTDVEGGAEVWHYITYEMATGMPLYRGWYHRYYMWGSPLYPWYLDHHARRERERFSVVIRNGVVIQLEHER